MDGGDPERIECAQLSRVRPSIVVGIPPHLQLPEHGILGVDDSVVVGVEQPQRAEARRRVVRIEELREELPPAGNLPVMVAVQRQQAVLGLHPGDPLDGPVAVQIEVDTAFRRRLQQHAVLIQVEDDRIAPTAIGRSPPVISLGHLRRGPLGLAPESLCIGSVWRLGIEVG